MATDPNAPDVDSPDPNPSTESDSAASSGSSAAPAPDETTQAPGTGTTSDEAPAEPTQTEPAEAPLVDKSGTPDPARFDEASLNPSAPDASGPISANEASDTGLVGASAPATDNTVDGSGNTIIVPSGGAATPNSPVNVHADNALVAPADTPQGSQDPALLDPVGNAIAGKEGRTSDPATRIAETAVATDESGTTSAGETHPDTVPPDISEGTKPSDAGADAYPFPVQGDVEVALVPREVYEGEKMEPIYEGDFVVLGVHELVPERLQGAQAAVLDAPTILCNCDWAPRTHEHVHPTAGITVQTRDDVNARLTIPLAAISRILRGGRVSR